MQFFDYQRDPARGIIAELDPILKRDNLVEADPVVWDATLEKLVRSTEIIKRAEALVTGRIPVVAGGKLGNSGWGFDESNFLTFTPGALDTAGYNALSHYFKCSGANGLAVLSTAVQARFPLIVATVPGTPARRLHVVDTAAAQLRLEGAGGAYCDFNVDAAGLVSQKTTGTTFDFLTSQNALSSFQMLANSNSSVFSIYDRSSNGGGVQRSYIGFFKGGTLTGTVGNGGTDDFVVSQAHATAQVTLRTLGTGHLRLQVNAADIIRLGVASIGVFTKTATPATQAPFIANATDPATTMALVNSLKQELAVRFGFWAAS